MEKTLISFIPFKALHQNPYPFRWTSLALALHLAVFLTQYLRWSVF